MFIITPVVPLAFIFLFVFYLLKIKGKYIIYFGLGSLGVLICFFQNIMQSFFSDVGIGTSSFINRITGSNLKLFNFEFSGTSWLVIVVIALLLAGYFLACLDRNKKREKAGVKPLDKAIEEIGATPKEQKADKTSTIYIGKNQSNKKVYLADNAKHVLICGSTGSGKTVAISNIIFSACVKGQGLVVVDGKGDINDGSLLDITVKASNQYNRKIIVIDMNNPAKSKKYNPFQHANATVIKDMLVNMTEWTEPHYKTNVERYIQLLAKLMLKANTKISYDRIVDLMQPESFMKFLKELVDKEIITKEEHVKYTNVIKSTKDAVIGAYARFATISESELGDIFDQEGGDIFSALKQNAVILFILNPLLYPETSSSFGRLILIDTKKAVSRLYGDKVRKFFIFDEANVYMSNTLVDLINKSRSANVCCVPAIQSLADLEESDNDKLKKQVMENCNNYLILRQNTNASAEELSQNIGTKETLKMTYQMSDLDEDRKKGSMRPTLEYIVHPNEIKNLQKGEAFFVSKDTQQIEKIKIHKPF